MSATLAGKRAAFRRMHESGCFVLPNPWNVGSAMALESLGFKAIASTSAGLAWSMGRPDNKVGLDLVLNHLTALAGAVDIPLNADFENGFADDPAGVGANVALAVETGVAGLSVEDSTGDAAEPLYDFALAVERIAAARAAIDASGSGVVLTARSEGFIAGRPDFDETVRRLRAFAAAGADCLYAPGLSEESQIAELVRAVAPEPVNVLTLGLPVATLAGLGVRRISVGGSLARAAWGEFLRAAGEISEVGTFTALAHAEPGGRLNKLFSARKDGVP
ncbi:MAG: isocitrate lyase/phosphoenolpyruvate mutase family protein [Pseudomonadota bacterium]|nr:isocitrate lyase/phosphoenolpyruvate mutase family protein [Pseudomonadota bacterium]